MIDIQSRISPINGCINQFTIIITTVKHLRSTYVRQPACCSNKTQTLVIRACAQVLAYAWDLCSSPNRTSLNLLRFHYDLYHTSTTKTPQHNLLQLILHTIAMTKFSKGALLLHILLAPNTATYGFVSNRIHHVHALPSASNNSNKLTTAFRMSSEFAESGGDNSNYNDSIESARKRLEERIGNDSASSSSSSSSSSSRGTHRLSSTAKERRKHEIELLNKLRHGDEAMNDLWALWFVERGPAGATALLETQELFQEMESASTMNINTNKAERKIRSIISEHGHQWAEPVNRLATLYFLQGKFKESIAMCELVLEVKPWHFGSLSGIVLCYGELGDRVNARLWSTRRLPPMEAQSRREEWVDRAVEEAWRSLDQSFQSDPMDDVVVEKERGNDGGISSDGDAWQ